MEKLTIEVSPEVMNEIQELSKILRIPVSEMASELVIEGLEAVADQALSALGDKRECEDQGHQCSHEDAWKN